MCAGQGCLGEAGREGVRSRVDRRVAVLQRPLGAHAAQGGRTQGLALAQHGRLSALRQSKHRHRARPARTTHSACVLQLTILI